jgi:hypothetical protein
MDGYILKISLYIYLIIKVNLTQDSTPSKFPK